MRKGKLFLGLDQGTTGTTALVFDHNWVLLGKGYREHASFYPRPGWIEQDPQELWQACLASVWDACQQAGVTPSQITCMGLDNQGETVLVWNRETGSPLYPAIVWQDRRTTSWAEDMETKHGVLIREKTGLSPDAYFSASKICWILDHVEGARELMKQGKLLAGTLDTWLIWKLTGGRLEMTDASTASRTMLLNIHTGNWDTDILELLGLDRKLLPEIRDSASFYGFTHPDAFFQAAVPLSGSAVDQQAALFGQACYTPGSMKTTYGTGCFLLMNTGASPSFSRHHLLTTIAWRLKGKPTFALDGGVYIAGAAVQWLRDGLGIIENPSQTSDLAASIPNNGDVFFVPAFSGLAAPHWDSYARGMIIGITGGTSRKQLVRAALESIAYQVSDNLEAMRQDSSIPILQMKADGGMTVNPFLMQFQADILGIPIEIPKIHETTALGAARLAALGIGFYSSLSELEDCWELGQRYEPSMSEDQRLELLDRWHQAVERCRNWANP